MTREAAILAALVYPLLEVEHDEVRAERVVEEGDGLTVEMDDGSVYAIEVVRIKGPRS